MGDRVCNSSYLNILIFQRSFLLAINYVQIAEVTGNLSDLVFTIQRRSGQIFIGFILNILNFIKFCNAL